MSTETIFPTNTYKLARLGELAAELLEPGRQPEWLLRRKEKVTLLDDSVVRRQMSVDFCLPKKISPLGKIDGELLFYAPLFFLPKGLDEPFDAAAPLADPEPLFANFDLREQHGIALSLPPRRWNAMVTTELLAVSMHRALSQGGFAAAERRAEQRVVAAEICSVDSRRAEKLLDGLRAPIDQRESQDLLRALHELEHSDIRFARTLEACAYGSVVMMPLFGRPACRGIVKLSFDEQVTATSGRRPLRAARAALGWAGYELWVQAPYLGSGSYHFEFQAPDGLEIYDAGLVELDRRSGQSKGRPRGRNLDRYSGYAPRLHLYEREAREKLGALAWVRLRVRRGEFVAGAAAACVFSALVMWAAWLFRKQAAGSPTAVPTLLLLVPSVIAAYAARPSMHLLTARMLANARRLLVLAAIVPFAAAGFFALTPRDANNHVQAHGFEWFWLAMAILASLLAGVLIGARAFPLPELKVRDGKSRLQRHLALQFSDLPAPAPRSPWITRWSQGRLGRLKDRIKRWRETA